MRTSCLCLDLLLVLLFVFLSIVVSVKVGISHNQIFFLLLRHFILISIVDYYSTSFSTIWYSFIFAFIVPTYNAPQSLDILNHLPIYFFTNSSLYISSSLLCLYHCSSFFLSAASLPRHIGISRFGKNAFFISIFFNEKNSPLTRDSKFETTSSYWKMIGAILQQNQRRRLNVVKWSNVFTSCSSW